MIPLAKWERHRSYPEADGGVIWWDRPVFDRVAFYGMAHAVACMASVAERLDDCPVPR